MCEGGVATWKRSSGPRPSTVDPVVRGQAHGAVGVAHRLGQPGGPRAEDQDRLVVPPRVRLGPRAGLGRGPRPVRPRRRRDRSPGRRPSSPASRAAASPSATAWTGPVRSRAWPTSTAFQAGLSSTAAAPSLLRPWTATMNSARLAIIRATRSPRADALGRQVAGEGVAQLVEVPERPARSPRQDGARSPNAAAARSSASCIRELAIGNILLLFEIDRQQSADVHFSDMPIANAPRDGRRPGGAPRDHRDRPAVRGPRGHPGRLRPRARGRVPGRDRRADARARPVRGHHPRGLRRARARPA